MEKRPTDDFDRQTRRPEKPAPLNVLSERSKAEWRKYLRDCAFADEVRAARDRRQDGRGT